MKEFINAAHAQGMCNGKLISAASNPWKITLRQKSDCVCECIRETIRASGLGVNECYVFYNGVQQMKLNGKTFIRVGYGIYVKYMDCDSSIKSITKKGSALFFEPPNCNRYTVHIPNPPFINVCENKMIVEFAVVLCG